MMAHLEITWMNLEKNILKNYEDMDNVTWQDENILLEIKK